ncbi:hypothetical protein [Isobaculum melis]|uniref:Bacteriocin-associated integral membrane (Putative immunity) protein n=1 Tax=Isobaculum melis TaxID=142588 RepID=A0A1H9TAD9_9LACT|nr:hypothetical protein [Isobaculum melis]SER93914.1 hypothetical protein SAMN04488559_11187 [Isobaculum melis]
MNIRKVLHLTIKGAIVIQVLLCLLTSAFFLSEIYKKNVTNYGINLPNSLQFSITSLSKDNTDMTHDLLLNSPGTLIRQTPQSTSNGNDSINVQIGGLVDNAPALEFLGNTIIDSSDLHRLLTSENRNATIGMNIGSKDTIKELQTPLFGVSIYFSKLSTSLDDTLLGNYVLVGLNSEQQAEFISKLSEVTSISKNDLLFPQSGYTIDSGLVGIVLSIGLFLTVLILGILVVSYTLASIKEIGSLALLGWGKVQILNQLFSPIFWFSLYLIPVSMVVSLTFYSFNLNILRYSLTAGIINTFIVLIILGISSFILFTINSLNAIKGILPKKILYLFVAFLYLLSSLGLLVVSYALDAPIQQVAQNKRLLSAWSNVGEYETLKTVFPGENQTSIAGLSDQLDHEMYNWYQSMENNPGVYYITSQYYDEKILFTLKESANQSVPNSPFTLITASPNYVQDHNINIPERDIEKANQGIRVFLIPNHWSDKQVETAKKWLSEEVLSELIDSSFENEFYKNKNIEFIKYDMTSDVFTWATQKEEPTFTKEAIISIVTTANMTPFDAGNLRANVLTGPLKFKSKKIMTENTKHLSKYDLDDNDLEFTPVTKFVDGLQKQLTQTIAFFGSVIAFIVIIIMLILVSMAFIFSIVNGRTIFVKEIIGFSSTMIYKNVMLFVLIMGLIELLITLLLKATLGMILIPVIVILQLMTIRLFIKKHAIQNIKGH